MTVTAKRSDTHHVPVVFFPLHGEIAPPIDGSYYKGCGERNGIEREIIVFGISPYGSNAMLSDNPNSGIYEAQTSRTLDLNGGNPACNQGGMNVLAAIEGTGSRPSHHGMGFNDGKTMYTLNCTEVHGVIYELPK